MYIGWGKKRKEKTILRHNNFTEIAWEGVGWIQLAQNKSHG
jgi:hypothetical protein